MSSYLFVVIKVLQDIYSNAIGGKTQLITFDSDHHYSGSFMICPILEYG